MKWESTKVRSLVFVGIFVPILAVKREKRKIMLKQSQITFSLSSAFTIREHFRVRHNVSSHHWRLLPKSSLTRAVRCCWGRRRTSGSPLGVGSEGGQRSDRSRRSCSYLSGTGIRLSAPFWLRCILRGWRSQARRMCRNIRRSGVHRCTCSRCIRHQRMCRRLRRPMDRDERRSHSFSGRSRSFLLVSLWIEWR